MVPTAVLVLALASPAAYPQEHPEPVSSELAALRAQVASLEQALRRREQRLEEIAADVRRTSEEAATLREQVAAPVAAPYLSAPPPSSDSLGAAKVAVFAPRVQIDSSRSHDELALQVRRVEARAVPVVGQAAVGRSESGVDLPIDRSGALYIVEWSTSEGHTYTLSLVDGASGQTAVSVQVKPLQAQGRLVFVGYKVE
jgi:hypothetical protein